MSKSIVNKIMRQSSDQTPLEKQQAKIDFMMKQPAIINFVVYMIQNHEPDYQIALKLGLKQRTFDRWKSKHIELWQELQAFKKEEIVTKGRAAFIKRALGFTHHEIIRDEEGSIKEVQETYYPPDPSLLKYLMKNIDPDNFKDTIEQQHTQQPIPSAFNFILDDKSTVELAPADFKDTQEDNSEHDSDNSTIEAPTEDTDQ